VVHAKRVRHLDDAVHDVPEQRANHAVLRRVAAQVVVED